VKVVVFDVLGTRVRGARVLDLYSGSGALGLEALSRGARHVVMVEQSAPALAALRRNVAALDASGEVEVVRADALRYLASSHAAAFDLVLADPPYAAGVEDALLAAVPAALGPGGCLVLQHARQWHAPTTSGPLAVWQSKRFGDTVVDFYLEEATGGDEGAHGPLPGNL
jgi:16S rRNA (guanine966-N2)-methyltransferase